MADQGSLDMTLIGNGLVLKEGSAIRWGPVGSNKSIMESGGVLSVSSLALAAATAGTGSVINTRHRVTLAEMNAGHTLLAAIPGYCYRLTDWTLIAIGGAAAATAAATGVGMYGTQSASAATLYEAHNNELTQSAINKPSTSNTHCLADGASFVANDANTAITTRAVSAGNYDLITVTHFDFLLSYVLEA